ncbi:MAG: hypothetical protein AABY22_10235 [Nanoarchaeota archaeon]
MKRKEKTNFDWLIASFWCVVLGIALIIVLGVAVDDSFDEDYKIYQNVCHNESVVSEDWKDYNFIVKNTKFILEAYDFEFNCIFLWRREFLKYMEAMPARENYKDCSIDILNQTISQEIYYENITLTDGGIYKRKIIQDTLYFNYLVRVKVQRYEDKQICEDVEVEEINLNGLKECQEEFYIKSRYCYETNQHSLKVCDEIYRDEYCPKIISKEDITQKFLDENCECIDFVSCQWIGRAEERGTSCCNLIVGCKEKSCLEYKCKEYKVVRQ